jgi:hypothetical protein
MMTLVLVELYPLLWLAVSAATDSNDSDFSDIGKLMIAGFLLAVCSALTITFVRQRLRDRNPEPQSDLISINSFRRDK